MLVFGFSLVVPTVKTWVGGVAVSHQQVSSSRGGSISVGGSRVEVTVEGATPQVQTTSVRCPVSIHLDIESTFL